MVSVFKGIYYLVQIVQRCEQSREGKKWPECGVGKAQALNANVEIHFFASVLLAV